MVSHSSLYSGLAVSQLLASAPRTADANSAALDTRDSEDCALLFAVGAAGDTLSGTVYIELEVQESDDNTTFTAAANADLTNYASGTTNTGTGVKIAANAGAAQAYLVGYKGYKRYVRGVVNVTGTHTTGTPVGVLGLKGRNRFRPTNVSN